MQNIIPDHRQQVLAHLRELDPVQVQLSKRPGAQTPHRLVLWVHSLVNALERWRQRRATIRVLNGLSDWQLADIGIRREGIPAAVDLALAGTRGRVSRSRDASNAPDRLAA
ncbi:MAG: DUF1127 domain-containing protein [Acidiferrobacterales bacterium]|nr:DUF1127 domain-containing protein [Acidiferrobacterales bacterium]